MIDKDQAAGILREAAAHISFYVATDYDSVTIIDDDFKKALIAGAYALTTNNESEGK